jgi:hypothetical protein
MSILRSLACDSHALVAHPSGMRMPHPPAFSVRRAQTGACGMRHARTWTHAKFPCVRHRLVFCSMPSWFYPLPARRPPHGVKPCGSSGACQAPGPAGGGRSAAGAPRPLAHASPRRPGGGPATRLTQRPLCRRNNRARDASAPQHSSSERITAKTS